MSLYYKLTRFVTRSYKTTKLLRVRTWKESGSVAIQKFTTFTNCVTIFGVFFTWWLWWSWWWIVCKTSAKSTVIAGTAFRSRLGWCRIPVTGSKMADTSGKCRSKRRTMTWRVSKAIFYIFTILVMVLTLVITVLMNVVVNIILGHSWPVKNGG